MFQAALRRTKLHTSQRVRQRDHSSFSLRLTTIDTGQRAISSSSYFSVLELRESREQPGLLNGSTAFNFGHHVRNQFGQSSPCLSHTRTPIFVQQQLRQRRWFSDSKPPHEKEEGSLSSLVPALRKRVAVFNVGDVVSVYGIVFLIVAIVFTPFVANQMKKSDNVYDEIETDDPVAHAEKIYRKELKEEQFRNRGNNVVQHVMGNGAIQPKSVSNTIDMISDVLHSEALQSALASLVTRVLDSDQFQKGCQKLLHNLWNDLVNDPETTAQIVQLLNNAIQNKETQRAVRKLVMQIINDKEVYDELTRLLVRLGQEKEVLQATQNLLTESAHNALNDPQILDHSMEFATDVVGDDIVQRTSGEALRNTVSYAVLPSVSTVLSLVGIGLLIFGVSALFSSRASEREAKIVEKAMTTFVRSIQTTTAEGLGALLSIPGRFLSACFSLVSTVAYFPVQLIQHTLSTMGKTGEVAINAFHTIIKNVASAPGVLLRVVAASLQRAGKSVSNGATRALECALAVLSASFLGTGCRAIAKSAAAVVTAASVGIDAYTTSFGALVSSLVDLQHSALSAVSVGIGVHAKSFGALTSSVSTLQYQILSPVSGAFHAYTKSFSALASSLDTFQRSVLSSSSELLQGIRSVTPFVTAPISSGVMAYAQSFNAISNSLTGSWMSVSAVVNRTFGAAAANNASFGAATMGPYLSKMMDFFTARGGSNSNTGSGGATAAPL